MSSDGTLKRHSTELDIRFNSRNLSCGLPFIIEYFTVQMRFGQTVCLSGCLFACLHVASHALTLSVLANIIPAVANRRDIPEFNLQQSNNSIH